MLVNYMGGLHSSLIQMQPKVTMNRGYTYIASTDFFLMLLKMIRKSYHHFLFFLSRSCFLRHSDDSSNILNGP